MIWKKGNSYNQLNYRWTEKRASSWFKKTFYRFTITLAILAILLVLKEISHPAGEKVRESLRYILTTEWDIGPVVQRVVKLGLEMVNADEFDIPVARETMGQRDLSGGYLVPVSGKVTRGFGWSIDPLDGLERFHPGIDIATLPGTPVKAALKGKVMRVSKDPLLGYYVLLDHGEGTYTLYAGLAPSLFVNQGENVEAGHVLGEIGTLGDVTGGGLHFELREKYKLIDPITKLRIP